MNTKQLAAGPGGEVIVYAPADGKVRVDVRFDGESVWLTQRQMAEVFDTSTDNVSLHLKNIYATDELEEAATAEDFSVVRTEGQRKVRRNVRHYNLDAIISIGYRVNSRRAAHLLYFIVKDHPFTDGNKRIGALLFLLYLAQEGDVRRLDPRALTALTLLIAESAPANKDLMVRLIINLLAVPSR